MNKRLKFSLYILIILTTVVLNSTVVLGWDYTNFGSTSSSSTAGPQQVLNVASNFSALIEMLGVIIAIILVFVLAIQYMTATPSKKSAIRDKSWMYAIGIVLLAGIPAMMDLVAGVGNIATRTGPAYTGGNAGTAHNLDIRQTSPTNGGVFDLLRSNLSGSGGGGDSSFLGGLGQSTPVSQPQTSVNPQPNPGEGESTPAQPSNPPANPSSGYIPPASGATTPEALQPGDRIYFTVDGNGNINGGNWSDENYYYDLQPGDIVHRDSYGNYNLYISDLEIWFLEKAAPKGCNTFSVHKGNKNSQA